MTLAYFPADLHLHTVLSACAEIEMIPPLIMRRARQLGLQLLAVTDHNSAENAAAMVEAGKHAGITVLPGMEVQTREEVHLICLFDDIEQVLEWQEHIYAHLPPLKNREDVFGSQLIVDSQGEFIAFNDRLLLTSTTLSIDDVFAGVENLDGIVVPAHIDRPAYSVVANLGFIPLDLKVLAAEVSGRTPLSEIREQVPTLNQITLIRNGDAHRLTEMQNHTLFKIEGPVLSELRKAFLNQDGRKVLVE